MKKHFILFVSMLLAILVACTTESDKDLAPSNAAEIIELTAATSADSRIALALSADAQSIDLTWETGDSFDVYTTDGIYVGPFNYDDTDGLSSGKFTSNTTVTMTSGTDYVAYFPSKGAVVSLQAFTQTTNGAVDHLNNSVIMSAGFTYNSTGTSFVFDHEAAIIGFEFTSTATPATLTYSDGVDRSYTVEYTGSKTSDNNYTLYVAANTTTDASRNVAVTIYDSQGNEYDFSKSVTMATEAGYFYKIAIDNLTVLEYDSWKVGDLVYSDTESTKAIGMIVYVDSSDDTKAMALSFDCYHGMWDSSNPSYQDSALDDTAYRALGAGDDCYNIISKFENYGDTYEIFKWAQELGDDWYVTTIYDWTTAIIPAFQINGSWSGAIEGGLNKTFTEAGGTCIAVSGDGFTLDDTSTCIRYWSCNTSSTANKARAVRLYDSNYSWTTFSWNNEAPYARAVKYMRL